MTRREYLEILSGLSQQIKAAEVIRNEAHLQGAILALQAFLSSVEIPPPDGSSDVNEPGPSTR